MQQIVKRKQMMILCILFFLFSLFMHAETKVAYLDETIGGRKYRFLTNKKVWRYRSGKIYSAYLAKDERITIGGRSWLFGRGNELRFWLDGRIRGGVLKRDSIYRVGLNRIRFSGGKKGKVVLFRKDGSVREIFLAGRQLIRVGVNALVVKGRMGIFENDGVKWVQPVKSVRLIITRGRLTFKGQPYWTVGFHNHGVISEGHLKGKQNIYIGNKKLRISGGVRFNKRGLVTRCRLAGTYSFSGKSFSEGTTVRVRYSGWTAVVSRYRFPRR